MNEFADIEIRIQKCKRKLCIIIDFMCAKNVALSGIGKKTSGK